MTYGIYMLTKDQVIIKISRLTGFYVNYTK